MTVSCRALENRMMESILRVQPSASSSHVVYCMMRLYFSMSAQIAQVAQPMLFKYNGKLGKSVQQ